MIAWGIIPRGWIVWGIEGKGVKEIEAQAERPGLGGAGRSIIGHARVPVGGGRVGQRPTASRLVSALAPPSSASISRNSLDSVLLLQTAQATAATPTRPMT